MRVKIEIECKDLYDVEKHLSRIKRDMIDAYGGQTVMRLKKKVPPNRSILTHSSSGYGTHRAVFINEENHTT